ncbi:MAG: thymidine phosphorylase family protein [Rhodospirillaceae bacterium]|nr:thymidine phosphorylase family protein [Rhodospirillaceae bacterium]
MLHLKRIGIQTYGENVAFLSADCPLYAPDTFRNLYRVEIAAGERRIMCTLNIVENGDILAPTALGLSSPGFDDLGLPEGSPVTLNLAAPPKSLDAVRQKISGAKLTTAEIEAIIADIAAHRYAKMEIAAFLVACAAFMTEDEVLGLTRAMAGVGRRLTWDAPMIVDKHCIGGIPGNRTSMIVVPIVAAHGLMIPKTSSRAITSPAGTADTMEVLANVDTSVERMQDIVRTHKGCLVWGGRVNLSPADDIMITVERPLGIDTPEQMVASILSKKLSAGSTHLVIDIPVGPSAKVRGRDQAVRLRKLFEYVGHAVGLTVRAIVTDGSQPVGRGIGPVLEARDVVQVLKGERDAPPDLRERALLLAGHVLEFDPALTGGEGHARARDLLNSGAAWATMQNIMAAQGAPTLHHRPGSLAREITAPAAGVVRAIDNYRLARIARLAGAPIAKGAGIDLLRKVGEQVKAGEPLYRIHATLDTDFGFATEMAAQDHGYTLGP